MSLQLGSGTSSELPALEAQISRLESQIREHRIKYDLYMSNCKAIETEATRLLGQIQSIQQQIDTIRRNELTQILSGMSLHPNRWLEWR